MAKYEYKQVEKDKKGNYSFGVSLDELGREGWRLVSRSWDYDTFMREIDEDEINTRTYLEVLLEQIEEDKRYDKDGFAIVGDVLEKFKWRTGRDKNVIIPKEVKEIGDNAFSSCEQLESIVIPNSVTTIGNNAFVHCVNLKHIVIPTNIKKIGAWAFYNTKYYNETTNWENKVLYIGSNLIAVKNDFDGSCFIKEGTLCIADQAFEDCNNLTKVTIPESVNNIGCFAFNGCSNLENVVIPVGVTTIERCAFQNCSSLTSIKIPNSVTEIGSMAFYGVPKLTIHASLGSCPQEYAIKEGFSYIATNSLEVDLCGFNKHTGTSSSNTLLENKADLHIEVSLKGYEKEDRYWMLFYALLGVSREGRLGGSGTVHFYYLLNALYRYYNARLDNKIEECYNTALNIMAVNLCSSESIRTLKSNFGFETSAICVTMFFDLVNYELNFEKRGISPFKKLELKEFVDIFVRGFKKDIELSTDDVLFNVVKKYVAQIRNDYNLDCAEV